VSLIFVRGSLGCVSIGNAAERLADTGSSGIIMNSSVSPIIGKLASALMVLMASVLLASCTHEQPEEAAESNTTASAHAFHRAVPGPRRITLRPDSSLLQSISFAEAGERQMKMTVEATGQLQANANAVTRISAPVAGKVLSVNVCLGDWVKKGQVLATITSQEIGAMVTDLFRQETDIDTELAKELVDIDFEVKKEETQKQLCRKQFDRAKLLMDEKIGSMATVESSETELEKHDLTIKALAAKREATQRVANEKKQMARKSLEDKLTVLGMAKGTIQQVLQKRNLVNTIPICTPQGGIVLERNTNVGELEDTSRILFVVDDIDMLWLVADVFEKDIQTMHVGERIQFLVDSFPGEVFSGKLDYVGGTINPETRTLQVRAVIPNIHSKLKPKMFTRMKIFVGNRSVLAIPRHAVQDAGSQKVVYLPVSKNTFEERNIETAEEFDDYVVIKRGLRPGDKVVLNDSFELRAQSVKEAR
jgi:RND family efflux transporter, MFP subunit